METGGFNWQGWIGAAILIGLLAVLIGSLKQSAQKVDEGRSDLAGYKGGMSGMLLALVGFIVFMAFQNLALFTVLTAFLWDALFTAADGLQKFAANALPAGVSFLLYSAAVILLTWCRRPWVPKAASALLWIAGPVVSIPSFALAGEQPGLVSFGFPSAVALAGTVFLLFSGQAKAVYRVNGGV